MQTSTKKSWIALLLALAVFLCCITAATLVDRNSGKTEVQDVFFTSDINGALLHGRLYIPETATRENPAPAVMFVQGNDGESEKYSMLAVEFARRGYVAFMPDLRGQGKSVGNTGFEDMATGLYDALGIDECGEYLRALPFVDSEQIIAGGHSMGGVAAIRTAHNNPDWYKGLLLMGVTAKDCGISSSNTNLGPKATDKNAASQMEAEDKMLPLIDDDPNINILIVTGRDDGDAANHDGVAKMCGLDDESQFESGKVYGSYDKNNVRINYQAYIVHNMEYMSKKVIATAIDYVQNSMKAPNEMPATSQVWMWRYVFTAIAMIALLTMLLPLGSILLATPFFASVKTAEPEYKGAKGKKYFIFAVIAALLPPALYYYGCNHASWLNSKNFFNISRINCTLSWTILVAAITLILIIVGALLTKKEDRLTLTSAGLAYESKTFVNILKTLLLAVVMILAIYSVLAVQYRWSLVDVRIWNTAFRELNSVRMIRILRYFVPFAVCYIILAVNLYGLVRPKNGEMSVLKEVLINALIQAPWYLIWAIWLGRDGLIRTGGLPPFAGSMYAFFWAVPTMMAIISVVSTYFNRKTGHVYLGAFLSSLLICWTLCGGLSRLV